MSESERFSSACQWRRFTMFSGCGNRTLMESKALGQITPRRLAMPNARTDFSWSPNEEPHAIRRKQILEKYPQIKELFGPDIRLFPLVVAMVVFQVFTSIVLRDSSWPVFILTAWVVGGTISHSLSLAAHELSHSMCFEANWMNEALGIFANCAQSVPSAITFKRYHLEHHQKQGHDQIDVDIPTVFEGEWIYTVPGKLFFVFMQPFFYALRPVMVYPKAPGIKEFINYAAVICFSSWLGFTYGMNCVYYLLLSDWLGLGLHPISGHFISEHYEFVKDQETYSYYGPLNYLTWNVGYHNEHHDFPRVSGFRLPLVREIAKEYYENLPTTKSWPGTLLKFIFDDTISPFSRIKRHRVAHGAKANQTVGPESAEAEEVPVVAAPSPADGPAKRTRRSTKAD